MLYIGLHRENIKRLSETKMSRILIFAIIKDYLLDLASTQFIQNKPLGQNGPNPRITWLFLHRLT